MRLELRRRVRPATSAIALAAWLTTVVPALAHHPTGGRTPATFLEGLLSGIGHPVIGPDHLAFIVAIGIAAGMLRSGPALIAGFVAMSTAGVLLHVTRLNVPMVEPLVALTVVIAGLLIMVRGSAGQAAWMALAAAAGLFHGYAFGESIVGAEQTVIGAYLVGIALVTSAVAGAVMLASRRLLSGNADGARYAVVTGGALGLAGFTLLALSLVGT